MNRLRPNDQRAKTAITLLWVVMFVEFISLISSFMQYSLLNDLANSGNISMDELTANDSRERVVGVIYLLVFIISGVTFIQWFRRAYFNLHQRIDHLAHSEGWAAGAWFVPILNLFRPFQIMKELYEETIEFLSGHEYRDKGALSTSILGVWWAAWVINSIIGQFVFRASSGAKEISDFQTITMASIAGNIVGLIAGFLAIKVIKDYSKVEPVLMEYSYEDQINNIGSDSSDDDDRIYEEF